MRRKEKEITDLKEIEEIIMDAKVCHLALSHNDTPYVVPLSFGYKDKILYLHSAKEGKKIKILNKNNKVCFEFTIDCEILESDKGCKWGAKFRSVIGFGKAHFIEKIEEKQKALEIILQNYTDRVFELPEKNVINTLLIKINIEQITGKKSGY
ncbi:MAG: pyridoxamine 5'-phosphate oxidase family protein [Desulfobacteraceae bacterium]|nr:pyridoxamine 5'-phosphate oxidase family protein [Desulfobacteraceae bacterium]